MLSAKAIKLFDRIMKEYLENKKISWIFDEVDYENVQELINSKMLCRYGNLVGLTIIGIKDINFMKVISCGDKLDVA